jgi:hypothetical protein
VIDSFGVEVASHGRVNQVIKTTVLHLPAALGEQFPKGLDLVLVLSATA